MCSVRACRAPATSQQCQLSTPNFIALVVPPIRDCYLPGAFPSLAVSSVFLFRSTLLLFPPRAFYPSGYSRVFFTISQTIDRSRSVCPHLHETIPQDLTLEDRDSVEVSHEFRNRLLTELHRRFEQVS